MRLVFIGGGGGGGLNWYTHENMLYKTTCSTGPKSVLTLYCVPNVLFLTSVVTLVSRGNGWSKVVLYLEVSLG